MPAKKKQAGLKKTKNTTTYQDGGPKKMQKLPPRFEHWMQDDINMAVPNIQKNIETYPIKGTKHMSRMKNMFSGEPQKTEVDFARSYIQHMNSAKTYNELASQVDEFGYVPNPDGSGTGIKLEDIIFEGGTLPQVSVSATRSPANIPAPSTPTYKEGGSLLSNFKSAIRSDWKNNNLNK